MQRERGGVRNRCGEGVRAGNILDNREGRRTNLEGKTRQNRVVDFLGEDELVHRLVVFRRAGASFDAALGSRILVLLLFLTPLT